MKPDYDLWDLETAQADLWLFLQVDAICAQILADQSQVSGVHSVLWQPQSRQRRHNGYSQDRLRIQSYGLPWRTDSGALNGLLSQPILPPASPAPSSLPPIQAVSSWVN